MTGGEMEGTVPTLTLEQRRAALARAAEARAARARLKARVKAGEVTLEEVLEMEDPVATRMLVRELVASLPRVGKAGAVRAMEDCRISWRRRVGGLGPVQRERLLERFGGSE